MLKMRVLRLRIQIFGFIIASLLVWCVQEASSDVPPESCRVSGGVFLSPEEFALFSCAKCYRHMDKRLFANGTRLEQINVWLGRPETKEWYLATYLNKSSPIYKTFRSPKEAHLWVSCCKAAENCCEKMRETPLYQGGGVCPRTWDGWNCWPDTEAGSIQQATCPFYIYFHSEQPQCTRYSTKFCLENGTWFRNDVDNEYSDYSTCGPDEDVKLLLKVHLITFGISIVLLIPALVIFFYYRQLRVHRIFMHKNLFISFLCTGICVIIFESVFLVDSFENPNGLLESNPAGCKLFYTVTKYLRLSTYSWMFCEGFYLHKLIAAAFTEQKGVLIFHAIGWGLPVIPVSIWAIMRHLKADEYCWIAPSGYYEWIIYAPMLLALVVNFGFLTHIVQIIITKLRSTNTDEPAQFRRAVRATGVLIPLFGLHFLMFCYHPDKGDCHMQLIYNIATYSVDGLQGGLVSLLFCYLNNEVLFLLKRSYNRKKMLRDIANHMSSHKTRDSRTSVSTHVEALAGPDGTSTGRGLRRE